MNITINGFRKFNARADLKSMTWFRVQNNFYDQEDLYNESYTTCYLFMFLIAQCAQKNEETIKYNEDYLIFKSRIKRSEFIKSLNCLIKKQIVTLERNGDVQTGHVLVSSPCTTNERTNITNERSKFDCDKIYNEYPKKQGKALGLKKLQGYINNQEMYDKILQGAINYSKYIKVENVEARFVKQFSTWVNQECWDDEMSVAVSETPDNFSELRQDEEYRNEI